ncbi:unnamed protein product [Paramecium pentaurelia]|uniref:Centromere protein J C-terminal domain-containing protein n=1 Tax=Paramecium pentaurelia TaxID=43138 RepID=A0A8S1TVQ9_9CILI|nr:unnamed protein product [Paramecium pentaurelia]
MNLEEYLTTRMQEMSKFYNQLNIPIYDDIKLNVQVKEQPFENRSLRHFEQKQETAQNSFINEFYEEPQQQQNKYTDIFDEMPIKGAQKPFEQLLQDQGIVQQEMKNKKVFLKKGTRQFLSNAQTRSELSKREYEEILKMNNENALEQQQQKKLPVHFLQKGKGKQCTQKPNDSILDHTKNDETIIQQHDDKNELKKEKQLLEQQQKELQRMKIQQQKQLEQEKLEFEKWKEEEKKKIERITRKHYTIQQQRQQQLTTKQLEELDFLRKRVAQQNEEIKELKLELEKSQQQLQQMNTNQNTSTHNITKLIAQSSPPQSNYSTKTSNFSENKTNSYAMMHNKQGCINEEEEYESKNGDDQNSYQNGDSYEYEKIKIDLIQLKNQPTISIDMINDLIDESEFEFRNNKFYVQYLDYLKQDDKVIQQTQSADGKISRTYQSGKKEVIFNNGVKREVFSNGFTIVHFTNNDKKQTLPDGTIVYYFGQAKTTQITIQNGPQIYRFSNNQIEIHFLNGEKQIRFSDGTKKYIYSNGEEETLFSDGIFQKIDVNKVKYIEYPDGKIEITYPDGRIETQSQKKKHN